MREIKQHRRNICQIEATYLQKRENVEQDIGLVSKLYVRRFHGACKKDEFDQATSKHKQKLCRLGLNWQNLENNLSVVTNLSSKKLVNNEIDLLPKGLRFGILPGKFNFLQVRANLEKFYQECRPFLQQQHRIELKRLLIKQYSKLKSSFFYKKKEDEMALTRKEKQTLRALSQDTSIVICKPDKGNGVVVLDKKDYIKKRGTILKDKTKFQPKKSNANLENLKKFQGFLSRLKMKGALGQGSPKFFVRGPHKLLCNSSRAGHLT